MTSRLGRSVAKQELHTRMASPHALDVYSSPTAVVAKAAGRSSPLHNSSNNHQHGGSNHSTKHRDHNQLQSSTEGNEETDEHEESYNHVRELRRQREDDAMTQRVLVGEQTRRTQADEEMRAARVAADQKVAAMQHEIMTLLHGGVAPSMTIGSSPALASNSRTPQQNERVSSSARHNQHRLAPSTTPSSRLAMIPSSPLPPPPASPSSSRRPPSQSQQQRPIDSSLKLHFGPRAPVAPFLTTPKVGNSSSGGALRPLPASPASESLAQWLPHIQAPQSSSSPGGGVRTGGVSSMCMGSSSPRGGGGGRQTATSAASHMHLHSKPPSRWAASSPAALRRRSDDDDEDDNRQHHGFDEMGNATTERDIAQRRWLPQSFLSSNFQSIVKWAEMSFGEALVAQAAVDAASSGQHVGDRGAPLDAATRCDGGGGANAANNEEDEAWRRTYRMKDDAQPSSLLTTAYCAIIDELLWNLPGFQHVWEKMRGEIFSSIFRLKKKDLVGAGGPISGPSHKPEDPNTTVIMPTTTTVAAPLSLDIATNEQLRLKWFSRVCGRRATWFDTASAHVIKSHELQQTLDNIHVSLEKYDLIFDIYDRTADRQITERVFRAWKTTTFRAREHNFSLQQVFARLHKRSPVLVAFHGWRRLIYQKKLRSSKDKDATVSAVNDARMKAKAEELDRLQRQLEQETLRLRNNAEREARKHAALVTNHAVEMRELQSCQEEKDAVIMSLEKIAKRWERLAKTCRPLLYRTPLPQGVMQIARGLHDAETEVAVKGPSPARLVKCREALDKVLCTWVNHVLDTIGSKATRIKNTASDVRDGEALMALCKYIIARSQYGGNGNVSVGGGGGGGGQSYSGNTGNWSHVVGLIQGGVSNNDQPFLSTARGASSTSEEVILQPARTTSPQPARTTSPQPVTSTAVRNITSPQARGRGASVASVALQAQQEARFNAMQQVQSLHAVVIKALYLGTAEGLAPLLISTCPFAAKIIGREDEFLQSPHPTVGAWILASLFVCEMTQTFSQISDPSDVRFGCPAESHFATQVPEFSLMLACDRTGSIATATSVAAAQAAAAVVAYVPQKKDDARESLRTAPFYQDGRAAALVRDRAAASKKQPKKSLRSNTSVAAAGSIDLDIDAAVIEDTASDVEAYLGKDEETRRLSHFDFSSEGAVGAPDELPMLGEDDNNLAYVTSAAASSATDDDDDNVTNLNTESSSDYTTTLEGGNTVRSNPLSPPPSQGLLGDRKASKPFTSFRRVPSSVGTTGGPAATTSPPLGVGALLSPPSRRGTTVSINESQPPTPPAASSVSPTPVLHSTASGIEFSKKRVGPDSTITMSIGGGGGGGTAMTAGATVRRAISPVRADLQNLPMHSLFRKLRRETRQKEEWLGLARLVSSVVLRYRVLDVDAPHKNRGASVIAPPADVEAATLPAPEVIRRSASFTKPAPVVPQQQQVPRTAQPTTVPRSLPSSSGTASPGSAPLSRQASTRHHSRGGSMFFSPEAGGNSDDGTGSSKPSSAQPFSPVMHDPSPSAQQRRSIVKFE